MVKIEIEINGKNLEFKVPPLQATLILHFAEKDVWSLTELSNHMLVAPTVLRRKILFWVQRGILRQCTMDTFMTNEKHPNSIPPPSDISTCLAACEEEEEEDKTNSDAEQEKRKKDNKMFWFYIKGMLKNFQSLPLDRIHKMLQMFAINDSNMQIELSQLKRILNENVQQGYLVIEAGKFKLTDDMK
uniref:Anaphase-promoting complex subunit 2 C-terminal domain-containing protein n=1 Tax=Ciona savignyi TaxID=51511 RepID=H2ZEA6_CIOSA